MTPPKPTRWQRFWHRPVRAERLALLRIFVALALLGDQLVQYAPYLSWTYGPGGFAPQGLMDEGAAASWRWPILLFNTDNMAVIYAVFWIWVAATAALLVGYRTRAASVVVWFGAMCFLARNPKLKNGGDDVLQIALFLLMFAPIAAAFAVDLWRNRRRGPPDATASASTPPLARYVRPWAVRVMQLELCLIYLTTGLCKLGGETWRTGMSIHYVLGDVTIARWSYAQLPVPLWITMALTYGTLAFELGFPILVWFRRLRFPMLIAGVLFHLGIVATMEIGWFSFYTMAIYAVWVPDDWWRRYFGPSRVRAGADDVGETVAAGPHDYLVFFDTLCPICRRSRRLLERLDLGGRLVFRDIHDRERMAAEAPGVPYARALREIIVVTPRGRWLKSKTLGGFDAIRRLGWTLPALWPVTPLLYIPGVPTIARIVYRWVAKNRYRLVHCDDGTCDLHLRALSNAKLDEAEITRIVARIRSAPAPKAE